MTPLALTSHVTFSVGRGQQRIALVVHAAGGLALLRFVTTISVFKPWGKTRYGKRKA